MPVIPVQTRLAPPSPGNAELPLGIGVAPATTTAPAATPIRHSSFDIGHSAAPAAVDLRIDSLVLHGFSPAEGRRAGAAFEQELARLLTESPLSGYERLGALSDESRAAIQLAAPLADDIRHSSLVIGHSRGEATGRASARALHARLLA